MRGGSALPRPTPSSRPMPSRASSSSSRTWTESPTLSPIAAARSAKTEGVNTFDGSLQRSRAMLHDSARTRPRSTACSSDAAVAGATVHDHRVFHGWTAPLAALVTVAAVVRQEESLRDCLGRIGAILQSSIEDCDAPEAPLPGGKRRRAGHSTQPLHAGVVGSSASDQRDPRCPPSGDDRQDEELVRLGLEFLPDDGALDGLDGRLAEALEKCGWLLAFEHRQEEHISVDVRRSGGAQVDKGPGNRRRHRVIIW